MAIKVKVFAVLRDYFDESFEIKDSGVSSIKALKEKLIELNSSSSAVLNACRFAVNEEFVSTDYELKENEQVFIVPPSSGG